MILDELKNMIKDLENILLKDTRFRKDYFFKNQVKIIYEEEIRLKPVSNPIYYPYYINTTSGDTCPKSTDLLKLNTCPKCKDCPKQIDCPKCGEAINYSEGDLAETDALMKTILEGSEIMKGITNRTKLTDLSNEDRDILLKKLDDEDIKNLTKRDQVEKLLSIPKLYSNWKNFSNVDIKKIIM